MLYFLFWIAIRVLQSWWKICIYFKWLSQENLPCIVSRTKCWQVHSRHFKQFCSWAGFLCSLKVVSKECQRLCKRGSGSILQTKSYDSIFRFTWDELNKEIQIRAPNMLQIVSSIISDTVIPPTEKKYVHLMNTVATALHGRSDQMSCLQYQVGFILTHGACKQRVRFI